MIAKKKPVGKILSIGLLLAAVALIVAGSARVHVVYEPLPEDEEDDPDFPLPHHKVSEIQLVIDSTFSGAQHGVGVYSYNDTGGPYTISMTDVLVDDYQKTAVALSGDGLTVDLTGVTTVGQGDTGVTAQNGIQVGIITNMDRLLASR